VQQPRMTTPTALVLGAILRAEDGRYGPERQQRGLYGREICALTRLETGTVHPLLNRLNRMSPPILEFTTGPAEHGGFPRKYWRLTKEGKRFTRLVAEKILTPPRRSL
jgi:DNA-binding PadR family transcriptional regulator